MTIKTKPLILSNRTILFVCFWGFSRILSNKVLITPPTPRSDWLSQRTEIWSILVNWTLSLCYVSSVDLRQRSLNSDWIKKIKIHLIQH